MILLQSRTERGFTDFDDSAGQGRGKGDAREQRKFALEFDDPEKEAHAPSNSPAALEFAGQHGGHRAGQVKFMAR